MDLRAGYFTFHPKPFFNYQLNRWYSLEENAAHHCQMGNLGLALDVMMVLARAVLRFRRQVAAQNVTMSNF